VQDNDIRRDIKQRVSLILLVLLVIFIMAWSDFGSNNRVKVYNCDLSEISPDYPIEVKEECRKLRLEEWRRQNDPKSRIST
jgi:hypothetical protein